MARLAIVPALLCLSLFLGVTPVLRAETLPDPATGSAWRELDRILALVNGAPCLLSDLLLEKDFGLLQGGEGGDDLESLSRAYLQRRLILEEIREFGGFSFSPGELSGAVTGYLSRFPVEGDFDARLARWGISRDEIVKRLEDALTASLYTESRIRFLVQVLPADVENEYRSDPARWGGKSLEEAWGEVRDAVATEAFSREVERWIASLRDRYQLTLFEGGEKEER